MQDKGEERNVLGREKERDERRMPVLKEQWKGKQM